MKKQYKQQEEADQQESATTALPEQEGIRSDGDKKSFAGAESIEVLGKHTLASITG